MLFSDVFVYLPLESTSPTSTKKNPDQSLITFRHRSSSASILAAWHSSKVIPMFGTCFFNANNLLFVEEKKVKQEIGIQLQVLDFHWTAKQKNIWIIYKLLLVCFPGPGKHLAALMERVLTLTIFALHSLLSKVLRRCGCLINARMHGLTVSSSRPCFVLHLNGDIITFDYHYDC